MYYVYLIRSKKDGKCYIGYTKDLRERIRQHNLRRSVATKSRAPFELIYYEAYKSKKDAKEREEALKYHGQAVRRVKERLKDSLK